MSELTREQHLLRLKALPPDVLESIAVVVESAEVQGGYEFNGEDSFYMDDPSGTLEHLAQEIRRLGGTPPVIGPRERKYPSILVVSNQIVFEGGGDEDGDWEDSREREQRDDGVWLVGVDRSDIWDALYFFDKLKRRLPAFSQFGYRTRIIYDLLMAGF